jgi:protein-S-isoprenylcysteine O-methyltransferase Ste14
MQTAAPTVLLKARRQHTTWFLLLACVMLLFTGSTWPEQSLVHEVLEIVGSLAVAVCVLGRVWSTAYIGGRKDREILAVGPYSIVRNPLYVFSFIGTVGVGLESGTLTVPAFLMVAFVVYYHRVVEREEMFLLGRHGSLYAEYARRVPRWIPDFRLWHSPSEIILKPANLMVGMRDTSMFFLALPLLELLDRLQMAGILPVLLRVP